MKHKSLCVYDTKRSMRHERWWWTLTSCNSLWHVCTSEGHIHTHTHITVCREVACLGGRVCFDDGRWFAHMALGPLCLFRKMASTIEQLYIHTQTTVKIYLVVNCCLSITLSRKRFVGDKRVFGLEWLKTLEDKKYK